MVTERGIETNLASKEIVLEGYTVKQVVHDFGEEYITTSSYSLYHFLKGRKGKRGD